MSSSMEMGKHEAQLDAISDSVDNMGAHAQETAEAVMSEAIFAALKRGMTKEQIREILDLAEVNTN